ncbi:MAG: CocE/NonD family hydrolase [Bryobacteraceae bacterium]
MKTALRTIVVLGAVLWLGPSWIPAQQRGPQTAEMSAGEKWIREHYTKYEFLVAMRDGTRLFTAVYAPKDTSQTYPFLINRTPYTVAPYGVDNYPSHLGPGRTELFSREGFIFVHQDVRGKGRSEGVYVHVRPVIPNKKPGDVDETTDTYDTVDWLLANISNNNGRAGIYGISYPGFYATMGAIDAHPAMKAVSPQAPVTDWFVGDDFRHNGVLWLPHAFNFLSSFGQPRPPEGWAGGLSVDMGTPDGYDFFRRLGPIGNADEKYFHGTVEYWRELARHDVYDDYWQSRNPRPHLRNVKPAVLTVGGWFDAEDVFGPPGVYEAIEKQSPETTNLLVEGPWVHGGWSHSAGDRLGQVHFNSPTSAYFQENIEYPFFLWYLKGKGEGGALPKAYVFETGRDEWHKLTAWPPKEATAKTLYFHANGGLSWAAPQERGEAYDEYVSDPARPVPFTSEITRGMTYDYMVEDQRWASKRPDVLTYETEPLQGDVRVAGPLKASLHVSTTGTDSDFIVKLIDVYPGDYPDVEGQWPGTHMGGYQQLLRGEPFRGKFRHGFDKPEPFTPGKLDQVEFALPGIFHTFRRGHRIMVQVQSTWFPLCDLNPQKFMHIYDAQRSDFQKATERVYHSAEAPSSLTVLTLE